MIEIIYDGDCPFCARYMQLLRLRESSDAPVALIDARQSPEARQRAEAEGLSLDEGMAVVIHGQWHHGAEALERIALLSSPSNRFNRFNAWVFKRTWLSRLLYPLLRSIRNLSLRILGVSKITES